MIRFTHPFLLFTIGLGSCLDCSGAVGDEPVLLRYRFVPGQVVRYSVQMRDDYVIQVGETMETPYNSQSSIKNYRVIEVDDEGNGVLELTVMEQIRVEIEENDQILRFDSTKPDEPVPAKLAAIRDLVGKPHLRLKVTPTGKILEITPLRGELPQDAGGEEKLTPEEILQSRQAALDVLIALPEGPVNVGDEWTEYFEVPVNIPPENKLKRNVKLRRSYKLASVENNRATLDIETRVITPVESPEERVQLIRRSPKVKAVIDLAEGLLVEKSLTLSNRVEGLERGKGVMSVTQKHLEKLIGPVHIAAEEGPTTE